VSHTPRLPINRSSLGEAPRAVNKSSIPRGMPEASRARFAKEVMPAFTDQDAPAMKAWGATGSGNQVSKIVVTAADAPLPFQNGSRLLLRSRQELGHWLSDWARGQGPRMQYRLRIVRISCRIDSRIVFTMRDNPS
jgi:hypothetical protein